MSTSYYDLYLNSIVKYRRENIKRKNLNDISARSTGFYFFKLWIYNLKLKSKVGIEQRFKKIVLYLRILNASEKLF